MQPGATTERPTRAGAPTDPAATAPQRRLLGAVIVVAVVVVVAGAVFVTRSRSGADGPIREDPPPSTAPADRDGWRYVRPAGAGFIVEMPGDPTSRSDTGPAGTRHWTTSSVGATTYMAMWFDVPEGTDPAAALEATVADYGASTPSTYRGRPARELRTESGPVLSTGRAVIAGRRVLFVLRISPTPDDAAAQRFVDSLGID